MKLTLSLTHRCNLACRYCYAGHCAKPDMSLETARKSIDMALRLVQDGRRLDLSLFGGEPLLRFDLVQASAEYATGRADKAGVPLRVGLTTNGTLLSPDVLDFTEAHDINLCVSLDGPQDVHDRNRRLRDGTGTFAEVRRGLELALARHENLQVNAVFGPGTLDDLPRTFRFLTGLGVRAIHFSPDINAAWTRDAYDRLAGTYMQVAEHYIDCYRHGIEVAVNLVDAKAVLFIKGGYAPGDRCAMGDGEWAVAPSGNLYPCERFIGEDDDDRFQLGNIYSGFDPVRRCAIRAVRGNQRPECLTCRHRDYCMSWCGCTNYFMSGRSDMPAPALCAMEQAAIGAARHVFETLVQEDNERFAEHMFNYMEGGCQQRDDARQPAPAG